MGYGRDLINDNYYDLNNHFCNDSEKYVWVTSEGNRIDVRNMSVSHIINCMNLAEYDLNSDWYDIFVGELRRRGIIY